MLRPFVLRSLLVLGLLPVVHCAPVCPDDTAGDAAAADDAASWQPDRDADARPPLPRRVLVYSRSTGFRHDSVPAAVDAITAAVRRAGIDADATEDLARVTPQGLAAYGAVVLVSTTGEPFGPPSGAPGLDALFAFVRGGGGVVGVHAVEDIPGCNAYAQFIGGTFRAHPGNVRAGRCAPSAAHPAVAELPQSFAWTDEFHEMWNFRPDNHVVLRCDSLDGTARLPIAYWRLEGAGRLFVSTLGHPSENWSSATLVDHHVLPAIRWVLRLDG